MSRPRAGHGWTWRDKGNRRIHMLFNDAGNLITTGAACGWRRCERCRKPMEGSPFNSGWCPTCYFYKRISIDEFWRLHDDGYYLAPYNIGKRMTNNLAAKAPWENRTNIGTGQTVHNG